MLLLSVDSRLAFRKKLGFGPRIQHFPSSATGCPLSSLFSGRLQRGATLRNTRISAMQKRSNIGRRSAILTSVTSNGSNVIDIPAPYDLADGRRKKNQNVIAIMEILPAGFGEGGR
jgi:hypothetical protein